jgi:heme-degrading monooxygenase HmoA
LVLVVYSFQFTLGKNETVQSTASKPNPKHMIRHSVVFKLKHPKNSPQEKEFMDAAMKLSSIPGVHHFECLRQTSKKNNFEYCLIMEFDANEAYEKYNIDPDHVAFVQTYWAKNVQDFMELDYEPYP